MSQKIIRPVVGVCILNPEGKVLICQKTSKSEKRQLWQLPQGGIESTPEPTVFNRNFVREDRTEYPSVAGYREALEELGLSSEDVQLRYSSVVPYEIEVPENIANRKIGDWGQKVTHQDTFWVVFQTHLTAEEIQEKMQTAQKINMHKPNLVPKKS